MGMCQTITIITCGCLVVKISQSHTGQGTVHYSIHYSTMDWLCRVDSLTTRATVLLVLLCCHKWNMGGDSRNHRRCLFCQAVSSSGGAGQVLLRTSRAGTRYSSCMRMESMFDTSVPHIAEGAAAASRKCAGKHRCTNLRGVSSDCVQDIVACKPCEDRMSWYGREHTGRRSELAC